MTQLAFYSDVGQRENLEDAAFGQSLPTGVSPASGMHAFGVMDGVGGNNCGEVASQTAAIHTATGATATLTSLRLNDALSLGLVESLTASLVEILADANQTLLDLIDAHPGLSGMATTAVCALAFADTLVTAWVGDSRCYIYSQGTLRQITHDHSRIQELIDDGEVLQEEAADHPDAHVITRFLGHPTNFEAEVTVETLLLGDIVLLCSDGLTECLTNDDIAAAIEWMKVDGVPLEIMPSRLVDHALNAGATDNVTVLCYQHYPLTDRLVHSKTCTAGYLESLAQLR